MPGNARLLSRTRLRGIGLVLAGVALALVLVQLKDSPLPQRLLRWLTELGPWGPVAFIAVYVVGVLLFLPGSVLTVGAGAVFGFVGGTAYVAIAAMISSTLCFLIARHGARDWVARRLATSPKLKSLDDAVAREGWKIVLLLRLTPIAPFSLTNYGFGLTRVPIGQYMLATLAVFPGTMMYVYIGTLIGDLGGLDQGPPLPPWAKWLLGLGTVITFIGLARFAKRALDQRLGPGTPEQPLHR
jgi:uncharacterized membrane protein YdjX (TVP38/TMEM64 family)